MTSEQHLAPFRMPDRLFAELAAGGGSAAAVAFLERAEGARRLLLLRPENTMPRSHSGRSVAGG
ncbi:hypothetical protein ACFYMI_18905 [Streptomyces collinus]|uniref:hypothetical protein n=1 Tax=Streptomyces collinus TaxID=42684 RepID=UPI0036775488